MPETDQDVLTTRSRRAQPRAWLKAVTWLVHAGAHPKALATTTLSVAIDLAERMDFERGIVLYDLEGTARRVGVSRATVKRHVKILRELGALVWLQHGSRRNLRILGRAYTATATVYGATIPTAYDHALGHRLSGSGYGARHVGFTEAGREQAIATARAASVRTRREPPSRTPKPHSVQPDQSGRSTTTRPARAEKPKSKSKRKSLLGRTVTAATYQAADRLARALRPLHPWLQRTRISQLSWALADKAADGLSARQVNAWLHEINPVHHYGPSWQPAQAHAYVAAQLLADAARARETAQRIADEARATAPNEAFHEAVQSMTRHTGPTEEFAQAVTVDDLDATLLQQMRAEAWLAFKQFGDMDLVLTAAEGLGLSQAARLYGHQLVDACIRYDANPRLRPVH
ncbi:hypothetical protein [Streptomyces goshikiensis]|uniref:hypothetical protein n=1 Tax=Streptomyces goshikiensis TaxID=1942 RepID=UPI0036C5E2E4